jgi:hypothetical protein
VPGLTIRRLAVLVFAAASSSTLAPGVARAEPSVEACATAYEDAQRKQARGALVEARELAASCSDPACPSGIVRLCAPLAADIERAIPTIVLAAIEADGRDVVGARVVVDEGRPASLDGRAVALDPGSHRLRFVHPDPAVAPLELEVTLEPSARNRRIEARFPARATSARASEPGPNEGSRTLLVPAIVAFGVGGAGLAFGAVTGGLALGEDGTLEDVCPTPSSCPAEEQGRIDRAETLAALSTVGFVVGGAGLAAGVVLLALGEPVAAMVASTRRALVVRF